MKLPTKNRVISSPGYLPENKLMQKLQHIMTYSRPVGRSAWAGRIVFFELTVPVQSGPWYERRIYLL